MCTGPCGSATDCRRLEAWIGDTDFSFSKLKTDDGRFIDGRVGCGADPLLLVLVPVPKPDPEAELDDTGVGKDVICVSIGGGGDLFGCACDSKGGTGGGGISAASSLVRR